jgi:hypothetical protein
VEFVESGVAEVKALTIYQPWASLSAFEEKKIETRSWHTRYRGPLAIHAAQKYTYGTIGRLWSTSALWRNALIKIGVNFSFGEINGVPLHHGVIIATCNLIKCLEVIEESPGSYAKLSDGTMVDGCEYEFGDYSIGRYAWILADIRRLLEPIPAKGRQGLWNWEPPKGVMI